MHGQLHARCPLRLVRWARSVPRPAQSHSGCIAGRGGRARPARVAVGRGGARNLRRGSRLRRHGACLPYSDTLRDGLSWTGHTFRLSSQCETQCSWYTQPQPPKLSMHGETCIPVLLHWLPVGRGSDGASRRNRRAIAVQGVGGARGRRAHISGPAGIDRSGTRPLAVHPCTAKSVVTVAAACSCPAKSTRPGRPRRRPARRGALCHPCALDARPETARRCTRQQPAT